MTITTISCRAATRFQIGAALLCAATLTGCATSANPKDPYENFNRSMFKFNDGIDRVALKPAATIYKSILPSFVKTGVSNFFGNLSDVSSAANNLLQGKGEAGMSDFTRVVLNSSFGLIGLLDIASEAGMPKHNEDFGQTLGFWGVKPGPYVMLPLLGPSTVRDTFALPVDIAADPWHYKKPTYVSYAGTVLRVIDARASSLDATNLLEEAALDRYEFVRDGYLQRRDSKVFDGEGRPRNKKSPFGLNYGSDDDDQNAPVAAAGAPALSSEPPVQELTVKVPVASGAGL